MKKKLRKRREKLRKRKNENKKEEEKKNIIEEQNKNEVKEEKNNVNDIDKNNNVDKKEEINDKIKIEDKEKNKEEVNNNIQEDKKEEEVNNKIQEDKKEEKDKKEIKENEKNKYDNYELNNMEYEDALRLDKRSMIKSYWSIINREHLILLTFCSPNDFNISFVKFARFIFLISTEITLNAYLFADETMHKVYLSYGEYDFVQHIAQIIMTTVFSQLMEVLICYLSLSDSSIYQIKELARNNKQKQETLIKVFDILNCINKKIKYFFVFTFLLMAFYWYSVACFCAVYRNTQIIFLKDCGLSFLLELIEPFILYSFPSIFRAISLKGNNLSCLYKLSDLIPIF